MCVKVGQQDGLGWVVEWLVGLVGEASCGPERGPLNGSLQDCATGVRKDRRDTVLKGKLC